DELRIKVKKIVEFLNQRGKLKRIEEENLYLRKELELHYGEMVGSSQVMKDLYETIKKVAAIDSSILIMGESGTGKELVARAIHNHSKRSSAPFIKVSCGALAEGVLESELFGHEKGAFTGAYKMRRGRFELADRGTIFLDEIGEISLGVQVKLLQVLQEKRFERVGGEKSIHVDVRIISATNKNVVEAVKLKKFREDLFYRLNVIPIHVPPLRERKEDIPELTQHFIKKIGAEIGRTEVEISEDAMQKLIKYEWPGNIRELENVIERAMVFCDSHMIRSGDLPVLVSDSFFYDFLNQKKQMNLIETMENLEKILIQRAMEWSGGVKTKAARILGIKTGALYYKLEKYEMLEH
ncbi:MAG: sigma-54 interaction domain-containing protein, partial [Fidelibacterota bacterium]